MTLSQIVITGTFLAPDGSPASGTVCATLSDEIVNGVDVIAPSPICGVLNSTGQLVTQGGLPFKLYANDDPASLPPGSTYSFVFQIPDLTAFSAVVPHGAPGATIDLSALIPAAVIPCTAAYIPVSLGQTAPGEVPVWNGSAWAAAGLGEIHVVGDDGGATSYASGFGIDGDAWITVANGETSQYGTPYTSPLSLANLLIWNAGYFEGASTFASVPNLQSDVTPFDPMCYWKDADGKVSLRGVVLMLPPYDVTVPVFTLPEGFRPVVAVSLSIGALPGFYGAGWIVLPSGAVWSHAALVNSLFEGAYALAIDICGSFRTDA